MTFCCHHGNQLLHRETVKSETKIKPVRRAALLSCKLEQVVPEEERHLVVLQQLAALGVFTVAAVEDVERAVVPRGLQILHVVLHLHLHRVSVVVLATFEFLVAVFAFETFQSPFFPSRPGLLAVEQDDGFVGPLVALDENLRTDMEGVHTLYVVLERSMCQYSFTSSTVLKAFLRLFCPSGSETILSVTQTDDLPIFQTVSFISSYHLCWIIKQESQFLEHRCEKTFQLYSSSSIDQTSETQTELMSGHKAHSENICGTNSCAEKFRSAL